MGNDEIAMVGARFMRAVVWPPGQLGYHRISDESEPDA